MQKLEYRYKIEKPTTLQAFLQTLGRPLDGCTVAVDRVQVDVARAEEIAVSVGTEILILPAVSGG